MNKVLLSGRMAADINMNAGGTGVEFGRFTVACERRKDKNGEKGVDFIDCVAFGKKAAFINQYFKKGNGITVEGAIGVSTYQDKETGKNRKSWSIVVSEVEFPVSGGKRGSDADDSEFVPQPTQVDDVEVPF